MANYKYGRGTTRKHDEWYYFDKLPVELRQRIAAATTPWSSGATLRRFQSAAKEYGHEKAIRIMLREIDSWDVHQAFHTAWISPKPGKKAEPTPCREAGLKPLITRYKFQPGA